MFEELTPLNRDQHQALRFSPARDYWFAAQLPISPAVLGEARMVAREYPLAFSRVDNMPLAVLGIKPGTNAYVDAAGRWTARYIPAHVRRYPFMLAEAPAPAAASSGDHTYTVMADLSAPQLNAPEGEALFAPSGEPTPTLLKIQQVLANLQRDSDHTRAIVDQIAAAGLFEDRILHAGSKTQSPVVVDGLRCIDLHKLNECPADTLHVLHRSGGLLLIHAHLVSLTNLDDGWLAKQAGAGAAVSAAGKGGMPENFSFDDIDWSLFGQN